MEIAHGRGFNHDAGRLQVFEDPLPHLHRRAHADHFHAVRRGQVHRTGNQHHAGTARGGRFGQRVAHFAA